MRQLIICPEYPPAPGGGIGTYAVNISTLLAENGETVHVIGQLWEGAEKEVEEKSDGRLIIHRIPYHDWTSFFGSKPSPAIKSKIAAQLFHSSFSPQCFSWQAALLAERLVKQEGIDLIETQDYEAPLYYFQVRRALGFGPTRCPPCMVHLHSPTEFIAKYNDWDMNSSQVIMAKRLEDYSIAAADVLLCPSNYLAKQVETHYKLAEDNVKVIPYPLGDTTVVKRDKDVWENGSICYLGRLERRKGVIEWIEAAVSVASEYPTAQFEFVGANVLGNEAMSSDELLDLLIPKSLKHRFHFRGHRPRSFLARFLAKARIAVVPSRWENFPYTCIEAMSSGLPVIASREGGMVEMIEDGKTGWLARKAGSEGLAKALRLALDTPAVEIAKMGHQAASDIRQICDNQKIMEAQLIFRTQIVHQGSKRSLSLPANLPGAKKSLSKKPKRRTTQEKHRQGLAVVITCSNNGPLVEDCLQNLSRQTRRPAAVVVVNQGSNPEQASKIMAPAKENGWQVIHHKNGGLSSAKNAGIEAVFSSGLNPVGFAFLVAEHRLQSNFVALCEAVLKKLPEVGLVSFWTQESDTHERIRVNPFPSLPYQFVANEAAPFSVVRTEALREAGDFRDELSHGYEDWDLFNAAIAAGWVAVTIPEILGEHPVSKPYIDSIHCDRRMRQQLLERFPELLAQNAQDLILLTESMAARSTRNGVRLFGKPFANVYPMLLRHPKKLMMQLSKKVKSKILWKKSVWISKFSSDKA
jgi:glycosyltransferase involved in cell wall biosynthesis